MSAKIKKRLEKRWEDGVPHESEALAIAKALARYLPDWNIQFGGDGDTGEDIGFALSLWIEDGKPDCK